MNTRIILLLSAFLIISWSCKKKAVTPETPETPITPPQVDKCLLTYVHNLGIAYYYYQWFFYDDAGRIIQTKGDCFSAYEGNFIYTYDKNEIVLKDSATDQVYERYSLDQQRRIVGLENYHRNFRRTYTYNSDGYLIRMDGGSNINPGRDTAFYEYTDGNLTRVIFNHEQHDYSYTKTVAKSNNYLTVNFYLPGETVAPMLQIYLGKQSKNLLGSPSCDIPPGGSCGIYSLDGNSNIKTSRLLVRGMDNGPAEYTYICK